VYVRRSVQLLDQWLLWDPRWSFPVVATISSRTTAVSVPTIIALVPALIIIPIITSIGISRSYNIGVFVPAVSSLFPMITSMA
jgi:hypothetical protein